MSEPTQRAIVLMNLGSPDSTQVKDVKRYLHEFLMDERVIDYPYLLRLLLVKGIIVPARVAKSAEAYASIWTKDGSPLIVITKHLQKALQQLVPDPVEITMRYGNPSPKQTFDDLRGNYPALEELIVVPMYPHYAMSSYETAVEYAKEIHKREGYSFRLKFVRPYFDESPYIGALAESMRAYLDKGYDYVLFSYHGLPERHIRKSDCTGHHCLQSENCCYVSSPAHEKCYRHQCFKTTALAVEKAGIPEGKYGISFQSRIGKHWLTPYTDIRLQQLPAEGVRNLLVICPAFVSDCLETLEEIAMRGKETFLHAGGSSYTMIPCLNIHQGWVQALAGWIREFDQGSERMALP